MPKHETADDCHPRKPMLEDKGQPKNVKEPGTWHFDLLLWLLGLGLHQILLYKVVAGSIIYLTDSILHLFSMCLLQYFTHSINSCRGAFQCHR